MIFVPGIRLLSVCVLLAVPVCLFSQDPPKPTVPSIAAPAGSEPAQTPAPAPAPAPKVAPGSDMEDFSIGLFGWFNPSHFHLRNGHAATVGNNPANLDYGGKNSITPGVELSFPAGKYNALRFSFFQAKGHGGSITPGAIKVFGEDFAAGETIAANYKLQNFKASWEYLSWPYPPEKSSFRFKTLFGVQYIGVQSTLRAPIFDLINGTDTTITAKHYFVYPSLGAGVEKRITRAVRWELKGEGFWLPHRSQLWDVQTFFAVQGTHLEVLIGGRALHFRTSPQKAEYIYATMPGAFLELRWRFKY